MGSYRVRLGSGLASVQEFHRPCVLTEKVLR